MVKLQTKFYNSKISFCVSSAGPQATPHPLSLTFFENFLLMFKHEQNKIKKCGGAV
jgi:hypothetical protein